MGDDDRACDEDGGKVLLYTVLRYAGLAGVFLFGVSFLLGHGFQGLSGALARIVC